MFVKKILLMGTLFTLPALSFADITIVNNTNYYGTASTKFTPCSNKLGVVVRPHEPYTVPQSAIDFFCGVFGCEVHVFLSQNCSGNEFATVQVNHNGITHIQNYDQSHFEITGTPTYVVVNQKSGLRNWFKFLF